MIKRCAKCALLNNQNICLVDRSSKRDPMNTVCENYHSEVPHCDICSGLFLTGGILTETPEGWKLICDNCYAQLGTCATCVIICGVDADTSGIPKTIPQEIRQGDMIMLTTITNPKLTEKYCPSCKCFINKQCQRQLGQCKNYNSRLS